MTSYKRVSQTNFERMTDEEIVVGADYVRRQVWERGDVREVISVDGDRGPDGRKALRLPLARLPMRSRPGQ